MALKPETLRPSEADVMRSQKNNRRDSISRIKLRSARTMQQTHREHHIHNLFHNSQILQKYRRAIPSPSLTFTARLSARLLDIEGHIAKKHLGVLESPMPFLKLSFDILGFEFHVKWQELRHNPEKLWHELLSPQHELPAPTGRTKLPTPESHQSNQSHQRPEARERWQSLEA